jgi:hypothetical protein
MTNLEDQDTRISEQTAANTPDGSLLNCIVANGAGYRLEVRRFANPVHPVGFRWLRRDGLPVSYGGAFHGWGFHHDARSAACALPDFAGSLDAMLDAESGLTHDQLEVYHALLSGRVTGSPGMLNSAGARLRAMVFAEAVCGVLVESMA